MGLLDEVKEKAEGVVDGDKVDSILDKVEETINDKTGGKFSEKVDAVTDSLKEHLGGHAD